MIVAVVVSEASYTVKGSSAAFPAEQIAEQAQALVLAQARESLLQLLVATKRRKRTLKKEMNPKMAVLFSTTSWSFVVWGY